MYYSPTAVSFWCQSSSYDRLISSLQIHGHAKWSSIALLVFSGSLYTKSYMYIYIYNATDIICVLHPFFHGHVKFLSRLKHSQQDFAFWFCRKVVLTQIIFYFILEDFVFYWGHRVLHTKWLYKHVHSVHHE